VGSPLEDLIRDPHQPTPPSRRLSLQNESGNAEVYSNKTSLRILSVVPPGVNLWCCSSYIWMKKNGLKCSVFAAPFGVVCSPVVSLLLTIVLFSFGVCFASDLCSMPYAFTLIFIFSYINPLQHYTYILTPLLRAGETPR